MSHDVSNSNVKISRTLYCGVMYQEKKSLKICSCHFGENLVFLLIHFHIIIRIITRVIIRIIIHFGIHIIVHIYTVCLTKILQRQTLYRALTTLIAARCCSSKLTLFDTPNCGPTSQLFPPELHRANSPNE